MNIYQRVVVCAAIRQGELIICGARHFDTVIRGVIKTMGIKHTGFEQGFIDQLGVFMTRKEAWVVADKAGQIHRPTGLETEYKPRPANVGDEAELFSENLY